MKIKDLFMMSIRNLWRRKLRTSLTVIGVVIGACSIILMLSLGIAMSKNFREQIEQMGSLTIVQVYPEYTGGEDAPIIEMVDVQQIEAIENVECVIPERRLSAYLKYGKYTTDWQMEIVGLSPENMELLGYTVEKGRMPKAGEQKTLVLGGQIPYYFVKKGKTIDYENMQSLEFDFENDKIKLSVEEVDYSTKRPVTGPNGERIKSPEEIETKVIGVMSERNYDTAYNAYVDVETFNTLKKIQENYTKKLSGESEKKDKKKKVGFQSIKVKVTDEKQVATVQEKIKELGFNAYSSMEELEQMQKISGGIQLVLGGIGGISLLVAAIGIANTMMMSTYERTREIGIMKVIGAKISDIQKMFLVEAALIGLIGGLIGVIFSYTASWIMNVYLAPMAAGFMGNMDGQKISVIPLWLAGLAMGFSASIGLLSGYFPARKAMKISALTAIRTE